jgi:hypothetical protein
MSVALLLGFERAESWRYIHTSGYATLVGAGTTTVTATLSTGEVGTLTVTVVP